jgi:hypothetical protein
MVAEFPFPQRSPEWFAQRSGKITGSKFEDVMKSGRKKDEIWGQSALTYLRKVAAEILTGEYEETPTTKDMEWGQIWEDAAVKAFNEKTGLNMRSCGFFENSLIRGCGSSPDAVDKGMTLEVKCKKSKNHMLYLLDTEELIKAHRWQVVGEALFTESEIAFIASFDPRFQEDKQLAIYEYPREDLARDKNILMARLIAAAALVQEWVV